MSKKVWVELCASNAAVTDAYLHAIGDSYSRNAYSVEYVYSAPDCSGEKDDLYVVAVAPSAIKLLAKGRKNIIFWAQGVWPEESLARHGSRIRFCACSALEKLALSKARRVFVVSETQLAHYEKKYSIELKTKSFVMACSNEAFHSDSFFVDGKYEHPTFLYAGSLAGYQCIDQMLDAFELAQSSFPEARLLFYTNQQDEAVNLVKSRSLKNVHVDYKSQHELTDAISFAKYGFVIRDDSVVNRVATPTKISTYIANGIIPVYSASLESFSRTSGNLTRLLYQEESFVEELTAMESIKIDPSELCCQYEEYFVNELNYESKAEMLDFFLCDCG